MASTNPDYYKLVGTKLERYRLESVAGTGGMGIVYRAQHEITEDIVAIKVLRPEFSFSDQVGVSKFFEEAKRTAALKHHSIVKVIGADYTHEGLAFIVMEWLDGHTLSDELEEQGLLAPDRVANLLDQICEAVDYAHGKKTIHRDLKPSNIMLVKDDRGNETVRVLDFGIAKVITDGGGGTTEVKGSPWYMSPEQTSGKGEIDHRADIYSLGVMLYQMLSGKVPFDGDTGGEIMEMHRSLKPSPLQLVNPVIQGGMEKVVLKAMAKRPRDRYQSAIELAREFRQSLNEPDGEIEGKLKPKPVPRRLKWIFPMALGGILAIVLVIFGYKVIGLQSLDLALPDPPSSSPPPTISAPPPETAPPLEKVENGIRALREKRYKDAIKILTQFPKDLRARKHLADAYFEFGNSELAGKKFKSAADLFEKALGINSNSAATHFKLGDAYYGIRRFDDAIEKYKQAMSLGFNNPLAYQKMGMANHSKGNFEEAKNNCKQAIALDANSEEAYECFDLAYQKLPNGNENAKIFYKVQIRQSPNNDLPIYYQGLTYTRDNNKNEAKNHFDKLKNLNSPRAEKLRNEILRKWPTIQLSN